MTLTVVTAAAVEPLSLSEAKAQLNIDHTESDALIEDFIATARARVEAFTRRRLITQTLAYRRTGFAGRVILPCGPVQSITSVTYLDAAGTEQTLAPSEYRVLRDRQPVEIRPAPSKVWPATLVEEDTVTITFVAGYGAAAAVPPDFRAALRFLVAHYEANREAVITGTIAGEIPEGVRDLLTPHVLWV